MNTTHILIIALLVIIAYFLLNKEAFIFGLSKKEKLDKCKKDSRKVCRDQALKLKEQGEFDELVADPDDPEGAIFKFNFDEFSAHENNCIKRQCGKLEGFDWLLGCDCSVDTIGGPCENICG